MESTFYPYLGALGWTGLFLLIGTIIRAKVKFFQTFLFPASLIGGIIGFFVLNAGWLGIPSSTGWNPGDVQHDHLPPVRLRFCGHWAFAGQERHQR